MITGHCVHSTTRTVFRLSLYPLPLSIIVSWTFFGFWVFSNELDGSFSPTFFRTIHLANDGHAHSHEWKTSTLLVLCYFFPPWHIHTHTKKIHARKHRPPSKKKPEEGMLSPNLSCTFSFSWLRNYKLCHYIGRGKKLLLLSRKWNVILRQPAVPDLSLKVEKACSYLFNGFKQLSLTDDKVFYAAYVDWDGEFCSLSFPDKFPCIVRWYRLPQLQSTVHYSVYTFGELDR